MDERARALAASLPVHPNPRRRASGAIIQRFEENVGVLRHAYRTLADDVRTGQFIASAAEWLLDNYPLVATELTEIRRNLPTTYARTLPMVAAPEHRGHARMYVMAGDVYGLAPHAGRGGWSWYTGSAAWMYRAGLERILGLRRRGQTFSMPPCIPASWTEYSVTWRVEGTTYDIVVRNPERLCKGIAMATCDGELCNAEAIPILNDHRHHAVEIVLGEAHQPVS